MAAAQIKEKLQRDPSTTLNVLIVGAGLGGVGAAISLLLSGHHVTILESASTLSEVGAGIQVLPNSCRILQSWGMESLLAPYRTHPSKVNMRGWQGNLISSMNFDESASHYQGTWYGDFHRAELHACLVQRARQLGADIKLSCKIINVKCWESPGGSDNNATVVLSDGRSMTADLVVGADGINSRMREILLGREDPPELTGDLAYRLLLPTERMMDDPELRELIDNPQVNYWLGPDMHAVNYVLRNGKLLNMVLLVPDDIGEAGSTSTSPISTTSSSPSSSSGLETNKALPSSSSLTHAGSPAHMRSLFAKWHPIIPKLLDFYPPESEFIQKWRLCIRKSPEESWSHPSGCFTLLGDAVHATLPYLASGAGMALEDAACLGVASEYFGTLADPSFQVGVDDRSIRFDKIEAKKRMLKVYEDCRRERTDKVVERGSRQQWLYHLADGKEQEERDLMMREEGEGEALAWRDKLFSSWLLGYRVEDEVRESWNTECGKSAVTES